MKKRNYVYVLILSMFVMLFGTVVHAEENPAFGSLNATYKDWLQQIYTLCSQENYAVAQTYDGSPTAKALVADMKAAGVPVYYCIFDGTIDTGKGVGVYQFEDGSYYFYYGDYVNGLRHGQGTYFVDYNMEDPTGIYYYCYRGAWANDKPNGKGTIRDVREEVFGNCIVTIEGTYTDGLENGTMTKSYFDGIEPCYYVWNSQMGIPQFTTVTSADKVSALNEIYGTNDVNPNLMPIQVYDVNGMPTVMYVESTTKSIYEYNEYGERYIDFALRETEPGQSIYAMQIKYHDYDGAENIVYPYEEPYYSWWYVYADRKLGVSTFTK